jgi:hypothetical protein
MDILHDGFLHEQGEKNGYEGGRFHCDMDEKHLMIVNAME